MNRISIGDLFAYTRPSDGQRHSAEQEAGKKTYDGPLIVVCNGK